jgi:hypothetical protein
MSGLEPAILAPAVAMANIRITLRHKHWTLIP